MFRLFQKVGNSLFFSSKPSVKTFPFNDLILHTVKLSITLLLNLYVPLCVLSLIYISLTGGITNNMKLVISTYNIIEILFYIYCTILYHQSDNNKHSYNISEEDRNKLIKVWIEEKNLDINNLLRWFNPINKDLISVQQCQEFFAWLFYNNYLEKLSEKQSQSIQQLTEKIQFLSGISLKKVNSEKEKRQAMRLTLDKLNVLFKPLLVYLIIFLLQSRMSIFLLLNGFQYNHHNESKYSYYVYEPINPDNTKDTLFFINGIGPGLSYLKKICELKQSYPNRKIIMLELKYITITPTTYINTIEDTLNFMNVICERHNIQKISLIGHSYGTFICSWLMKHCKERISKLTLIDPVCFSIWDSNLTRNFIYNNQFNLKSILCDLIVSKDLFIANTIARNFLWVENLLLIEDLEDLQVNVFLSEFDFLIDSRNVESYLKKSPHFGNKLKVSILNGNHGIYLRNQKFFNTVMAGI
ncbi:hypothetical protein K502DRAFT_359680 [Neoconidiobolus thromboides FSU 785]|nr:hypothetical protein K502DRAFT_359680 [Neoconidiobolus thromboides FSU 785]